MKIGLAIQGAAALKKAARQIERYPAQAARAGQAAVNDVASTVLTSAFRDISQRYNLPASYVREQFTLRRATSSIDYAVISARYRGIRLARFDANQITATSKRAKGDARRGIAQGRKQAGISIKVRRSGQRKVLKRAFLIPLRAGKLDGGNGFGIFVREGSVGHGDSILTQDVFPGGYRWIKGKKQSGAGMRAASTSGQLRHLYGPSPSQAFRWWIRDHAPNISASLAKAYAARLQAEIRRGAK